MATAKQLAYNFYRQHEAYFARMGYAFSWEALGEISQEYWMGEERKLK